MYLLIYILISGLADLLQDEDSIEGLQGVIPLGRGSSTVTRPTT